MGREGRKQAGLAKEKLSCDMVLVVVTAKPGSLEQRQLFRVVPKYVIGAVPQGDPEPAVPEEDRHQGHLPAALSESRERAFQPHRRIWVTVQSPLLAPGQRTMLLRPGALPLPSLRGTMCPLGEHGVLRVFCGFRTCRLGNESFSLSEHICPPSF